MSIVRQDAWTNDEDLVLAEVVLRHIREGSTQLSAFEEVGERLSRTAAACGFRWNSSVRKKYEAAIVIAKKQRKSLKKTKLSDEANKSVIEVAKEVSPISDLDQGEMKKEAVPISELSIDDVIEFLVTNKKVLSSNNNIVAEKDELKDKVLQLSTENEKLIQDLKELRENYEVMKQDYKLLIDIMDRAKQISGVNN